MLPVYNIQRENATAAVTKEAMYETKNLYLTLLLFENGKSPDMFLIPSAIWAETNEVFVYRAYNKPGQKSPPEYRINISMKNYGTLEMFRFEEVIKNLL